MFAQSWRIENSVSTRRPPPVTAQVFARPVGLLLGLDPSYNPFSAHPAYCAIADLPLVERVAEMRKSEVRAAIIADKPEPRGMFVYAFARRFEIRGTMTVPGELQAGKR